MTFDLESLKNAAADRLRGIGDRLKRRSDDAPLLTYGALCGMSLVPLVEAAGAGQLAPVFMALGNIVGGVGANLVANQIQQWADPCGNVDEAQVARWVAEHSSNTQVIEALDAILEKLDAVEQAKSGMSQEDQDWFLNALRDETERIGNLSRYQAVLRGHGLIAQGEHIVQANNHSLAIETVNGNVTFTTIEHQVNHTLAPPDSSTERARRRYLTQLRHRCNALPLAAMGSDQDMGEDVSLDQVYIDLDTLPRIKVAEKERQAQEIEFDHDVKRSLTALEAATQSPRLVLLGEPDSGKSTFVRQLAARLATACLGEGDVFAGWDTCLLPLLIILRDLAPRLSSLALDGLAESEQQRRLTGEILDQLASDLDRLDAADLKPDLRDTLIEGKAVLILDGLDEVPEALRELVRRSVHALLHEYPRLQRVIVTCRIRSYSGATVLRNFASHTLAPFDEEKIEKFITVWYNAQVSLKRMDGTKAEERSRDLIQAALEEHLREMSSNPMLLTTMAIIHQRDVGLPRERVRLYSQATQVLLNRWQKGVTPTFVQRSAK